MAISLGQLVKEARTAKQLSQDDLAERIGVSRVQVTRIEGNVRGVNTGTLEALVRTLDLDAGEALRLASLHQPAPAPESAR